jgi:hypothetical protein
LYYNVDEQGQPVTDLYGEVKCKKLTDPSANNLWLSKGERWVRQQDSGPRRLDLQDLSAMFVDGQPSGIELYPTAAHTGAQTDGDASDADVKVGQKRRADKHVSELEIEVSSGEEAEDKGEKRKKEDLSW